MMFSNTMLQSLSSAIESGRPLNAMLRASEYLSSADPIFIALADKAKEILSTQCYQVSSSLLTEVLTGKKLMEFSPNEQKELRAIREGGSDDHRNHSHCPRAISVALRNEHRGLIISRREARRNAHSTRARFPRATLTSVRKFG